jgi:hypothetical protein
MRFDKDSSRQAKRAAAIKASGTQNKRLILMSVLFVLVLVALFTSHGQRRRLQEGNPNKLPAEGSPTEVVALPTFDAAALDGLVRDAKPEERVLSEPAALDRLLSYVTLLTPAHYSTLETRELGDEEADAIGNSPSDHRARAYRARGYIERLDERKRKLLTGDSRMRTEWHGTLRLESGRAAHFVVLEFPAGATTDSFLRIDGLFLKMYSVEGDEGWVEAPLLVGTRAVRSYPSLSYVVEPGEKPEHLLATVIDDAPTDEGFDVAPTPFEAQWALMAFARDLDPDSIDWEAVPELTNELMTEMLRDGSVYRGQPIRIPVVQLQDAWVEDPGENPARIERVTVGWMGRWEWTNRAGVAKFMMPFSARRLESAKHITGRGFFFRNHGYRRRDGGWHAAPLFVMHSVDIFVPPELTKLNWILYGVGGLTVALGILFWALLSRDRRKSRALQEKLKQRRRERRAAPAPAPQGNP